MSFEDAFRFTIEREGGYSDHPSDRGGPTRWGISSAAYPDVDLEALTIEDARKIMRRDFWQANQCDALPYPVALIVFDWGVNSGARRAARALQERLGVRLDGIIGPKTLYAAHAADSKALCTELLAYRARMYVELAEHDPRQMEFLAGWMRRLVLLAWEAKAP